MNSKQLQTLHHRIAESVFDNLGERTGFHQTISNCDADILQETKQSVAEDVEKALGLPRLITAAELLAELVDRVGDSRKDGPLVEEVRAAIAAMLGEMTS